MSAIGVDVNSQVDSGNPGTYRPSDFSGTDNANNYGGNNYNASGYGGTDANTYGGDNYNNGRGYGGTDKASMSSNPDTSANVAKAQEHAAGLAETAKNSEVCTK